MASDTGSEMDIKLYAKSDSLIYSTDIDISFGLDKCSWIISKRGKMIKTERFEQTEGNIANVLGRLQITWDPGGKWESQRGCKENSYSQITR